MRPQLSSAVHLVLRVLKLENLRRASRYFLLPCGVVLIVSIAGGALYARSQNIMREHLREYLRATAAAAAMQFDGLSVSELQKGFELQSKEYAQVVQRLHNIRQDVPTIRYAYIMQKTSDPNQLVFVADADSLSSTSELDVNGNGKVDEDELPSFPGDLYPIEDIVALQGPAFEKATVDQDITVDAWGQLITGYAPIHNAEGAVIAVLGLDMQADAFERLSQSIFSFEALLLILMGGGLLACYLGLELWRRKVEAADQLDADRRALMDLASHQLGAPLTTFKWWLEILKERDGGKICKESDICVQMDEGIRRMDEIVRALRSIDIDQTPDHVSRCKLEEVIPHAVKEADSVLKHRKQTCTVDIAPELPDLKIDGSLLKGALEEIIENASMYSPEESTILIRAVRSGKTVYIDIIDKGDGIAPKDLPFITQKFTRGSMAYRRKPVGNGLGLWIVRSIIERAKGKLSIDSSLGKGTTVHIELPAA